MRDRIDGYHFGECDLDRLVRDLRGLFVEADFHGRTIREHFESFWAPIDAEVERRTEPWAPLGARDDAALMQSLVAFRELANSVVLADSTEEHR